MRQAPDRLAAGPLSQDHGLVFASAGVTPMDDHNLRRMFPEITQDAGGVPRERCVQVRPDRAQRGRDGQHVQRNHQRGHGVSVSTHACAAAIPGRDPVICAPVG